MYSKNKYCRGCREREELETLLSEEERELCRYELPPKYDGSRFSRSRKSALAAARSDSEGAADVKGEAPTEHREALTDSPTDKASDLSHTDTEPARGSEPAHLLDGLSHEELLIISLILIVGGSEDSGELMLLLLLLLLQA